MNASRARPETIQHWPGNPRGGIADKVDTKIAYDIRTGAVANWGFMVDPHDCHYQYEELFKLILDPEFHDPHRDDGPTQQEAQKWFKDYLACIYKTVNQHLCDIIPRFYSKRVEYRFSVPTTWNNPAMVAGILNLIKRAGYGLENPRHTAEIALTEAEAAAVYASKQDYAKGDVFLVCDAGGGTTDVNVLKVTSSDSGRTELEPLSYVEGQPVGSTLIDYRVEKLVAMRLSAIGHHLRGEPVAIAHRMMREGSRFESFKCNFGDEAMDLPTLRLHIPGLAPGLDFDLAHIQDSTMIITQEELRRIFDEQLNKMIGLIDQQLKLLQQTQSNESIADLVLSGGLGSSPYIYQRLKSRYERGASEFANAQSMRILRTAKPQLAVVHGLVMDRVQQIKDDKVVYKERCCRHSYGIVCRELYNASKHTGEPVTEDSRDGQKYALKQIDWLVVQVSTLGCWLNSKLTKNQGKKVNVSEGVKTHYRLKRDPGSEKEAVKTEIVMSTLPAESLPRSMQQEGAKHVCKVEATLTDQDMKLKNRHWYNSGPKHYRAEFDLQVLVGAADLKFQIKNKDGVISQKHEDIPVKWISAAGQAEARSQTATAVEDDYGLYRNETR